MIRENKKIQRYQEMIKSKGLQNEVFGKTGEKA